MNEFLENYLTVAKLNRWDTSLDYDANNQIERVRKIRYFRIKLGASKNRLRVANWKKEGLSNSDIANRLNIPESAVRFYLPA